MLRYVFFAYPNEVKESRNQKVNLRVTSGDFLYWHLWSFRGYEEKIQPLPTSFFVMPLTNDMNDVSDHIKLPQHYS